MQPLFEAANLTSANGTVPIGDQIEIAPGLQYLVNPAGSSAADDVVARWPCAPRSASKAASENTAVQDGMSPCTAIYIMSY